MRLCVRMVEHNYMHIAVRFMGVCVCASKPVSVSVGVCLCLCVCRCHILD